MNTLPQTVEQITATMMGDNKSLVESARSAQITTESDLSTGVDMLAELKDRFKKIEEKRTSIVKPINDSVSAINAEFKKISEPIKDATVGLSKKVLDYQVMIQRQKAEEARIEQEKRQEELLAAAQSKQDFGNTAEAEKLLDYATKVKARPEEVGRGGFSGAKSSIRTTWDFEVTDIKALANAMPELVAADVVGINRAIAGGAREIAGLRIFEKQSLAVRG